MKKFKLDNHNIEYNKIIENINGKIIYHVYYEYNNNMQQLDFFITSNDIKNNSIREEIKRLFTDRQLKMLCNRLLRG